MGTVTDLHASRRAAGSARGRFVTCEQCGERHPIIRLAGGELECVTAFGVEEHWFCRNRGCRAAWLASRSPQDQ
jgi:hypothetical protein